VIDELGTLRRVLNLFVDEWGPGGHKLLVKHYSHFSQIAEAKEKV